jgi:hypothetical protein
MTFPLLRFEVHRLVFGLVDIKKRHEPSAMKAPTLQEKQYDLFNSTTSRFEAQYSSYFDSSTRSYDWLCATFLHALILKSRLLIDFPNGTIPTPSTSPTKRYHLLRTSVEIIQYTYALASPSPSQSRGCAAEYNWFFRDFVQWHSLAIIIAELGQSRSEEFRDAAWEVLEPVLQGWDEVFEGNKADPAWGYVNDLIQRARRRENKEEEKKGKKRKQQDGSVRRSEDGGKARQEESRPQQQSFTLLMPSAEPIPERYTPSRPDGASQPYPDRDRPGQHYQPPMREYPAGQQQPPPHPPSAQLPYPNPTPSQGYNNTLPIPPAMPLPATLPPPPQLQPRPQPPAATSSSSFEPAMTDYSACTSDFSSSPSDMMNLADLDFSAFETVFGQSDLWTGGGMADPSMTFSSGGAGMEEGVGGMGYASGGGGAGYWDGGSDDRARGSIGGAAGSEQSRTGSLSSGLVGGGGAGATGGQHMSWRGGAAEGSAG